MRVDRLAARLLRRDVVRRSEHGPRLRDAVLDVERARDAEVRDLRAAVAVQQHVLRLHVAVDEPVLVGEREPAGDLDGDLERLAHLEAALADDELLQVLAVDVLEDDVLAAVLLAPVDHRDDVRVLELRDGARLALEALDEVVVVVVLLVQDLQRDVALEQGVVGLVDAGHAAVADDLLQLVSSCDRLPDHGRKLPPSRPASVGSVGARPAEAQAQPQASAPDRVEERHEADQEPERDELVAAAPSSTGRARRATTQPQRQEHASGRTRAAGGRGRSHRRRAGSAKATTAIRYPAIAPLIGAWASEPDYRSADAERRLPRRRAPRRARRPR